MKQLSLVFTFISLFFITGFSQVDYNTYLLISVKYNPKNQIR